MLDGDKLYTFREKYVYIHHVDYLSNKRLVLSDDCLISLNPNIPHIFRGSKESSVYHKIERPYSVFPNVHIGNFPNKQIRNIPSFGIEYRMQLFLQKGEAYTTSKRKVLPARNTFLAILLFIRNNFK